MFHVCHQDQTYQFGPSTRTHTCTAFGNGEERRGEKRRRWREKERGQEIKTEDNCKHFLETHFLTPLIHRPPSFPQQHLWALVPAENWSCARLSWAWEPYQIPIERFKVWGEVYLASNHSNADHYFTLSSVKNVLEPIRKQICTVHPLRGHPHLWLYGIHCCFRNYLFPGAIF